MQNQTFPSQRLSSLLLALVILLLAPAAMQAQTPATTDRVSSFDKVAEQYQKQYLK